MNSPSTTRHLFLCAVGRSGTTIFRESVGLHPEIYFNGKESNVVQDVLQVAEKNCSQRSRQNSMVIDQSEYESVFRRTITDLVWPDISMRELPVLLAAINPAGRQLDFLTRIFPNAKVVCLIRNGIEVVSSRMQFESFSHHDFDAQCKFWTRTGPVVQWGAENPERFRLFRQEWFYNADKISAHLEKLWSWLNISPCKQPGEKICNVLQHPTRVGAAATEQAPDYQAQSTKFLGMTPEEKAGYFAAKANRWLSWTDEQRSIFEAECSGLMSTLGYPVPWKS